MKTATAKEIQTEVLTAQEALIKEANELVGNRSAIAQHTTGLEELGFSSSSAKLKEKAAAAKELHDLHDTYSFEYPGLKFIPVEVMRSVCRKYGLAIGHVSRYTGEVPGWALERIKANKRHITTAQVYDREGDRMRERAFLERLRADGFHGRVEGRAGTYTMGGFNAHGEPAGKGFRRVDFPPVTKAKTNLVIAAPVKEMLVDFDEYVDENGEIQRMPESLDPIVCLEVMGGYIVLAAWGEEGSDPRVFNTANN